MELNNSVLFILEFEALEEEHLVGEIYAVGYTGLEIGREDQNVETVSSSRLLQQSQWKMLSEFRPVSISGILSK